MTTLAPPPSAAFRDTPLHQATLRVHKYRRGAIRAPTPGDAVRLTHDITGAKAGTIGILDGIIGVANDDYLCTFNLSGGTAFRGPSRSGVPLAADVTVSAGGGPALFIDAADLVSTYETHIQRFWCWRASAEADGGMSYVLEVPLWEWTPPAR